jgi:hypothetical protein
MSQAQGITLFVLSFWRHFGLVPVRRNFQFSRLRQTRTSTGFAHWQSRRCAVLRQTDFRLAAAALGRPTLPVGTTVTTRDSDRPDAAAAFGGPAGAMPRTRTRQSRRLGPGPSRSVCQCGFESVALLSWNTTMSHHDDHIT